LGLAMSTRSPAWREATTHWPAPSALDDLGAE
jgi:hypothetical protein